MNPPFGPWSSALGAGLSPRLSTFWKRRLALLGPARTAPDTLTRRDWLKLGIVGTVACAVPTLHLASAEGPAGAKAPGAGKIYLHADFNTGDGNDDSLKGIFAIDPESAARTKVCDF